jgi:hypothetical protein
MIDQAYNVFQYDGWRPKQKEGKVTYTFYKGDSIIRTERLLNHYLTDLNYLMRVAIKIYTDNKLTAQSEKWVKLHDTIFSAKLDLSQLFNAVLEAIMDAHSSTETVEFYEHMVKREYPQAKIVNVAERPCVAPAFYVLGVGEHKQDRPYTKLKSAWKAVFKSMQFDSPMPDTCELKISERCSY